MARIPSLTVGEEAFERGLRHGRAFAAAVAHNLETYFRRFEASGLPRGEALAEAARWLDAIARANPEYAEEMEGLARGAGRTQAEIALLNARYEIAFTLFGKDAARKEAAVTEASGCTTFGTLPEATADRSVWLGQNWDWLAGIHGRTLILRIRRRARPSLVCLTEAGIVGGKMGVNECGVGLVENGLASSDDGRHPYQKPFHLRCREVLDADRYEDALRSIVDTRRTCSANFVVGHADGEVIDVETSPDRLTCIHPRDGLVTHSNHFIGVGHGESQMEKIGPNTLYRASRLERLLRRDLGRLGLQTMRHALCDHFGAPSAICRHPDERQPEARRTMTAASVLIDLGARVMHVASGPPCSHPHEPFALAADE